MANHKNTPDKFWGKVEIGQPDECWPWLAGRDPDGYGQLSWHNVCYRAHRVAYALATNETLAREKSGGKTRTCVLHRCDNPPCCNPAHLWLGTNLDNIRDRDVKGRTARADTSWPHRNSELMLRGSAHGRAKLTEADIPVIRARLAAGEFQRDIGKIYGVTESTISGIKRCLFWRHVVS